MTGLPHQPHAAVRVAPDMFTRVGGTIAMAASAPEFRTVLGDERLRFVLPLGDFDGVDVLVGGTTAAAFEPTGLPQSMQKRESSVFGRPQKAQEITRNILRAVPP